MNKRIFKLPRTEIGKLKIEIIVLKNQNDSLIYKKKKVQEKKQLAKWYSEEDALKLLDDYYEFYDADNIYRNPKIRRLYNNEFRISLEECSKKGPFKNGDNFLMSMVMRLKIFENGNYDLQRSFIIDSGKIGLDMEVDSFL